MATTLGLSGILSGITSAGNALTNSVNSAIGNPIKTPANAGIAQAGYEFASFSSIALGSNPVTSSLTNIKPPNNYPLSNLQIIVSLTDTTSTTVPSGVNSIDTAIQQLSIIGASGTPIISMSGNKGEMKRWQKILNNNGSYTSSPTPADSAVSTAYTSQVEMNFTHLVIDPSEYPLRVSILPNTLSSRATTLNSMTSTINSVSLSGDFVPVSGYVKTLYSTTQVSDASTGYFNLGKELDNGILSAVGADFGADSKLDSTSTFYLASNNNTLLPYTSYNAFVTAENSQPAYSSGDSNHISGFFVMQTMYKATINGTQNISLKCNVASAPDGASQSNTINLYQALQY